MLDFGSVSKYLGYNALQDHFPLMTLRPNPECTSYWCRKQQQRYAQQLAERAKTCPPVEPKVVAASPPLCGRRVALPRRRSHL